ncbi:MFS transporter [Nocardia sp. CDC159]|uniref:MFS transporter n=1 Tax=Nocardia pulmonis TaxID=2951408 RepID=A0A9X2EBU9_9NOCA|nr:MULTISPECIES: MFS transporter [Nocardia]MCM6777987.1 MFS transporter [Nocardia pulmonis]MCM6790842.1 MFS transporter [Nocardia sp. CDC159]
MLTAFRTARALPPTVQLLLVNQFGVYIGFYLLIPFLATHLRDDLHLATGVVGAIIGIRSLSQQGLTLLGGSAADRIGYRPLIIAGCLLRAVGFAAFAVVESVVGLILAAVITGVAGAVFSPATRAYLAHESGPQRLQAFSLLNVAGESGTLIGPLLGSLLLAVDFRLVAIAAAAVFTVLTIAQVLKLPPRPVTPSGQSVLADWREVLGHRRFLLYVCATSGIFVLYNQLYLTLPLEAARASGFAGAAAVLFTVSTLVTLGLQVRITEWCRRRWASPVSIAIGLALCGIAFAPTAIGSAVEPRAGAGLWAALPWLLPTMLATVVLTLGVAVAQPFALDLATEFARPALTGTYLGIFATASGVAAVMCNTVVGYTVDLGARMSVPWLPWLLLSGYGIAAAALIAAMRARSLFPPTESENTRQQRTQR